jgi:uncharacterized phage protein (TIGR02218 family)
MKPSTPELDALLGSGQALLASLFTISLKNGEVLRLTSAPDFDVTWLGQVFDRRFVVEHGQVTTSVGIEVDEVDISLYPRPGDLIGDTSLPEFVRNRGFDGARVLIEVAFMSTPGVPVGVVHWFEGEIQEPEPAGMLITLKAASELVHLTQMVPRNTITPGCGNILFDGLCGVGRSPFTISGTAQAGSSRGSIISGLPQPDNYFRQGVLTFTDGQNAGAWRTVKNHTGGVLIPALPFTYPVATGDAFAVSAGCDKLRSTCRDKFDNEDKWRGFEKVPRPVESA